MTHQARDYKTKYTDWCQQCKQDADEKAALAAKAAHSSERFVRYHAAKWLLEQSIPLRPYGKFDEVIVRYKTMWRDTKKEVRFIQLGQGWLLGQHDFHYSYEGHAMSGAGTEAYLTLLTDQGGLVPVKWEQGQLVYGSIGSTSFEGSYDRVADEVGSLVGKPVPRWKV